jgi:hypothetical protein
MGKNIVFWIVVFLLIFSIAESVWNRKRTQKIINSRCSSEVELYFMDSDGELKPIMKCDTDTHKILTGEQITAESVWDVPKL